MKYGINFCHFAWAAVNKMKPRGILFSKRPYFLSQITPTPILNKFWMKIYGSFSGTRQYTTESIESLQICTVSYSCQQNARLINNSEWKISSKLVRFVNERFRFYFHREFHFWLWIGFSVFLNLKLKLKLKNSNIAYT